MDRTVPSAADLRSRFEAVGASTVGLEEEVMLLDPDTLDLAPVAEAALARAREGSFKLELPASQLEIAIPPAASVPAALETLFALRTRLARALGALARPACAGAHPFARAEGELNRGERYARLAREYGALARRQLVCALQVHVAIPGAQRALATYNALREHLPEIAALAANAPFHEGRDSGLVSVRPLIAQALPRQGIPPTLESWEDFARELRWGALAGGVPQARSWWWELRPNAAFGTLEVRVPDAQSTVAAAGAVAAVIHCLAAALADRHEAGELPPPAPSWRIAENRSAALRAGLDAELADVRTGERRLARERLAQMLDELGPVAGRLGCAAELDSARERIAAPGYALQREVAREAGMTGLARWLCERFTERAEGCGASAPRMRPAPRGYGA